MNTVSDTISDKVIWVKIFRQYGFGNVYFSHFTWHHLTRLQRFKYVVNIFISLQNFYLTVSEQLLLNIACSGGVIFR